MSKDQTGSDAIVIGAGIAGVCTALELSKSGYNVTVIERFPRAAQFCSMANAGLNRLHSPISFKSISSQFHSSQILQAFKSLSPTFRPNYKTSVSLDPYFFTDLTSYKWLYLYAKCQYNQPNKDTMDQFDAYCFNAYLSNLKQVQNATGYNFLSSGGYAVIYPSPLTSHLDNLPNDLYDDFTATKSIPFDNTSTEAAQRRVGSLRIETFPTSFISDCHIFCNSVAKAMNDIHFKFNTQAVEILVNKDNNVCGVTLDDDTVLTADKVVICAGVLTNNIIQNKVYQMNDKQVKQKMKLPYIPIVPLQGFTITLAYAPTDRWKYPYHTMEYYPSHIYASRINDGIIRFSAYGYFRNNKYATKIWNESGDNMESREGVQSNMRNATRYESELLDNMESSIKDNLLSLYDIDEKYFDANKIRWTGFRPYTPDENPIVDQVANVNGLYVNAGHGMLGYGTSHGTAKLVRKLMNDEVDEKEAKMLQALSLDRF